jgi:hypothetical protein
VWGVKRDFAQYKPGDSLTQTFSYTLPAVMKKVVITTSPYLPVGEVIGQGKPLDLGAVGFVAEHFQESYILNANSKALWDATAGVQDKMSSLAFTMYPNPAEDKVYLAQLQGGDNIEILSSDGRKVFTQTLQQGETQLELSTREIGLGQGLYYLRVSRSAASAASVLLYVQD